MLDLSEYAGGCAQVVDEDEDGDGYDGRPVFCERRWLQEIVAVSARSMCLEETQPIEDRRQGPFCTNEMEGREEGVSEEEKG